MKCKFQIEDEVTYLLLGMPTRVIITSVVFTEDLEPRYSIKIPDSWGSYTIQDVTEDLLKP